MKRTNNTYAGHWAPLSELNIASNETTATIFNPLTGFETYTWDFLYDNMNITHQANTKQEYGGLEVTYTIDLNFTLIVMIKP